MPFRARTWWRSCVYCGSGLFLALLSNLRENATFGRGVAQGDSCRVADDAASFAWQALQYSEEIQQKISPSGRAGLLSVLNYLLGTCVEVALALLLWRRLGTGGVRPHPEPVIGPLESSVSGFCGLAAKRANEGQRSVFQPPRRRMRPSPTAPDGARRRPCIELSMGI